MAKKNMVDGISLAIVILNIAIVGVLITLVVLIYMYMTGKLEETDVANMEGANVSASEMTTTPVNLAAVEPDSTDTGEADAAAETTEPADTENAEDTGEAETVAAVELDTYDKDFFANDLFIGDSIYTGLSGYGILPADNVFAQTGLTPGKALENEYGGYTAVTKAEAMQPKRIFIMLGTNGLAGSSNTTMAENMRKLVNEIRDVCPDSRIYVISIPPVTKAHEAEGPETMAMVSGYNKLLKGVCEDEEVNYLDLCSQLKDSTGYLAEEFAEADGLHFLLAGYTRMLSFFQRKIQGNM